MIQRIQSVYLLIVTGLMAITAFSPLFTFGDNSHICLFTSRGWSFIPIDIDGNDLPTNPTYGIVSIAALISLFALIAIFLYKKRNIQIKIAYATLCCILLFYITVAAYFYSLSHHLQSIDFISIKYGSILPILAFIFTVLAIFAIKKDQKLIKSLDRIR